MSGGAWSTRKTGGNILLENGKGGELPQGGGGTSPEERQELEAGVPNRGHQTPCWEERAQGWGDRGDRQWNDPHITPAVPMHTTDSVPPTVGGLLEVG